MAALSQNEGDGDSDSDQEEEYCPSSEDEEGQDESDSDEEYTSISEGESESGRQQNVTNQSNDVIKFVLNGGRRRYPSQCKQTTPDNSTHSLTRCRG